MHVKFLEVPMSSIRAVILFTCIMLAVPALSEPSKPKIGLVLGGGGAAGVAHVGVIEHLEAMGIRPDYVAGASMGAIVGGLYAAGYTPGELRKVVTDIDWESILIDNSIRSFEAPMRRKNRLDPLSVTAELPLSVGSKGSRADGGLVDGVKLQLILNSLTAPARNITNFDNLPIPFRAVATDLYTGKPVVLGSGNLNQVLRASMSIPALFPPVTLDGYTLVDGGVSNNLPIDVVRAMGADIVIASVIPPANVKGKDLSTFSASLSQTLSIFIQARSQELIKTLTPIDVLITPDVAAVGMLDFAQAPETIAKGIKATKKEAVKLQRIALKRPTPQPRSSFAMFEEQKIHYDRIIVRYDGALDKAIILKRLNLMPSGTVSSKELNDAIIRVYGMQLFSDVTYNLEQQGSDEVLVVTATSAADGSLVPSFGIALDNSFGGDGLFSLGFGATIPEINSLGGRLDIDATIGNIEGGRARFEQPLDLSQQFVVRPGASYFRRTADLYAKPDVLISPIEISKLNIGSDAFFVPGDWGRIGMGLSYNHTTSETKIGYIPGTNQAKQTQDKLLSSLLFDYDDLDNVDLPSAGSQLALRYDLDLLDPDKKGAATIDGLTALSFGQHVVSPFGYASGNMSNDGFAANFIGGFQRISGFSTGELAGNVVGVGGVRYYNMINLETPFGTNAFVGGSIEYGGAYSSWSDMLNENGYVAGALFSGVDTLFGPILLGVGASEHGQWSTTLTLGKRF